MRIRVNGKKWHIYIAEIYGLANSMRRIIYLAPKLPPKRRLNTLIHEMIHAISPRFKEKIVKYSANQIAKVLWKDGWRREHGRKT